MGSISDFFRKNGFAGFLENEEIVNKGVFSKRKRKKI